MNASLEVQGKQQHHFDALRRPPVLHREDNREADAHVQRSKPGFSRPGPLWPGERVRSDRGGAQGRAYDIGICSAQPKCLSRGSVGFSTGTVTQAAPLLPNLKSPGDSVQPERPSQPPMPPRTQMELGQDPASTGGGHTSGQQPGPSPSPRSNHGLEMLQLDGWGC